MITDSRFINKFGFLFIMHKFTIRFVKQSNIININFIELTSRKEFYDSIRNFATILFAIYFVIYFVIVNYLTISSNHYN